MDLWPYVPQRVHTESMEWLTDVIRAKSAEQRIALREVPRHGYTLDYIMSPAQFASARNFARARCDEEIQLPLWGELTRVGAVASGMTQVNLATHYAHYAVGKSFVVWEDEGTYEVRVATAVNSGNLQFTDALVNTYTNAIVMPVRTAAFGSALDVARDAHDYVRAQGRFVATDAEDLASLAPSLVQYDSHDVMLDRAVLIGGLREAHGVDVQILDSGTGIAWRGAEYSYPLQTTFLSWQVHTREELWDLRSWLHTRRGRWRGFWMPTWNRDLVLAQPIELLDAVITVESTGYEAFSGPRDIMIELNNGTRHFLRLTGEATSAGAGLENLSLEDPADVAVALADVALVSFLTFMRLDADRVEIRHGQQQGSCTLSAPVREVPAP